MKYKDFKRKIYQIIDVSNNDFLLGKIFDIIIIIFIILSVLVIFIETFHGIPLWMHRVLNLVEYAAVNVFTLEYLLRIYTADLLYKNLNPLLARLRYIFSFIALVDLLAFLPYYIPFAFRLDLRIFRFLRLLSIFSILKINRYTEALDVVKRAIGRKKDQLLSSMFVVFVLMVMISVAMYYLENEAQPEVFKNAFSGLWWAIVTLTAVGYGDIYPITAQGQILGAIISLLGIGLVAVPTGIISSGFSEEIREDILKDRERERVKEKELGKENIIVDKNKDIDDNEYRFCPHCGKALK